MSARADAMTTGARPGSPGELGGPTSPRCTPEGCVSGGGRNSDSCVRGATVFDLTTLGWGPFFASQAGEEDLAALVPGRAVADRGPRLLVRFEAGDRLVVTLDNQLPSATNLHTHGLHVSPEGNSDNVMVMLMSGDTFTYEYDLSKQAAGTLNFYHPHIHGSVAEQYWGGSPAP